jgi:hypothetical protein
MREWLEARPWGFLYVNSVVLFAALVGLWLTVQSRIRQAECERQARDTLIEAEMVKAEANRYRARHLEMDAITTRRLASLRSAMERVEQQEKDLKARGN